MKIKSCTVVMVTAIALLLSGCPNPVAPAPDTSTPDAPAPDASAPAAPTSDTVVSLLAIHDLKSPVRSATPVVSIDTDQYSGAVTWSPAVNGTFAAATVYTATVDITPKTGYTLSGVTENGFTVAGAWTVKNAADSGRVTVVFPGTLFDLAMVDVPAGAFQRDGTPENVSSVSAFKIGKFEVTRAQFLAIMGTDPSTVNYSSGMDDPVQTISWFMAIAFCNRLSIREGLQPVYSVAGLDIDSMSYEEIADSWKDQARWKTVRADWSASGYRLPTDMEWTWAAMGAPAAGHGAGIDRTGYLKGYAGSVEDNGAITKIDSYAWHNGNCGGRTHPVGEKLPNELGIHDMSGNVAELCWDWYSKTYPDGMLIDYLGPDRDYDIVIKNHRLLRGGYWEQVLADHASHFSVAKCRSHNPFTRSYANGFRLAKKL